MTDSQDPRIAVSITEGIPRIAILQESLKDSSTSYEVRDQIVAALKEHSAKAALLDLTQVKFIGSIGFLAFLGLRRELPDLRLVLCGMTQPIHDAFSICRLIADAPDMVAPFEVAADVAAGIALVK